jgi:hypothetical protein
MYPTPNCHFCEKRNVKIEEDTTHMLNCPNRDAQKGVAEDLWNQIWISIKKKGRSKKEKAKKKKT